MAQGARGIASPRFTLRRLEWSDEPIATIDLPARPLELVRGYGSGLARRAGDPPGVVWAVGDRGPNLKPKTLIDLYGLEPAQKLRNLDGAKVMPRLDVGPTIAKLRVSGDRIELLEQWPIVDRDGSPVSGLPNPSSEHARCEPAFDLECRPLDPDPSGLDTEGLIALSDGGFWVGDEFGPSLVRLDERGQVLARFVPENVAAADANYPVEARLPAIAAQRQLNRGFEAIALSPDERWLHLAFQSPLAHPDEDAHNAARHTRIWKLDTSTLELARQYAYPFDEPGSFARDAAKDAVKWSDIKVSELVCLGEDRLLVLERISATTKLQLVELTDGYKIGAKHLDPGARPTLEQLSATEQVTGLDKRLLFSSDDAPRICADLEGMVPLSPRELLLVNDNDFGTEGARTEFWVLEWAEDVLG